MRSRHSREKTSPLPLILALVATLVLSAGLYALGACLGLAFPDFDARPLYLILLVALALITLCNRLAAASFVRHHFGMPPEEREPFLQAHRTACRNSPEATLGRLGDMVVLPLMLLALYDILAALMLVAAGMGGLWSIIIPAYLLFMPLYRHFSLLPRRLNREALIPKDDLPALHAMARRAMAAVGLRGNVRLEITSSIQCDAGRFGQTYVVILGVRLLGACTEEELYQGLLRVLSPLANRRLQRRLSLNFHLAYLGSPDRRPLTRIFDLYFSYADVHTKWYSVLYNTAAAYVDARRASALIAEKGNPAAEGRRLAKQAMWRYFSYEYSEHDASSFYESPEPALHFESDLCELYRRVLEKRCAAWSDLLACQLPREGDLSVSFSDLCACIGVAPAAALDVPAFPDPNSPFSDDCRSALCRLDRNAVLATAPTYKADRMQNYLQPLAVIEAYESGDGDLPSPELSPIINAYRDIERRQEAEAICDRIIAGEDNVFATAHALYFKGQCLLHRYSIEGIDLIYRAMDINKNYMQEGLEAVEEYCCLCGLAEELAYCRRRAAILMEAHSYNQYSAGNLTPADHLVPETELAGELPTILGYMESVGGTVLLRVHLVRKVVSEDFFSSVFVLEFDPDASAEDTRHVYEAIFNFLDSYPTDWQFSLFTQNPIVSAALKKVPDTLVWERK